MPLANAFVDAADVAPEPRFPLDVHFCETCSLVQLVHVVDAERLFRHYLYVSGTSATMTAHHVSYAGDVARRAPLRSGDLLVEVACNDGSLLNVFRSHGHRTLGIEPAKNVAAIAREAGLDVETVFFGASVASELRKTYGSAKAVVANNVLAHVDDPQDFLTGCKRLISEDGVIVVEVPYLRDLLERLEYDTIYHEHLCYFGMTALLRLCDSVGLVVRDVERVPVHGGSLRLYLTPDVSAHHADRALHLADSERAVGCALLSRLERFAADITEHRRLLRALLADLRREGRSVAGYGAPAKGNTLLNWCGIGPDLLPYTVDANPLKVGLLTPGMHLPVLPVSALTERRPEFVLILAWNLAEEIIGQIRDRAGLACRFIVPIPEPRVI